jgi:8-oxo-dGTP diphosphatase
MKKLVAVSIALFLKDVDQSGFSVWMQVRQDHGELNGKWEFPGGKIESLETPVQAVVREVKEEVDCDIESLKTKLFRLYPYQYGEKTICLFPFLIEGAMPEKNKGEWFHINFEDKSFPLKEKIPAANIPLINDLCDYLKTLVESESYSLLWR